MNRTDHAAAIIRYAMATYASVGSSSSGLALERFTALLLEALVSVRSGIEGGDFEQRAEQDGLVDRAQAGFDHHAPELDFLVCVALAPGGRHGLKRLRHSPVLAPQDAKPTGSPLSRVRLGEIALPAPRTPSQAPHRRSQDRAGRPCWRACRCGALPAPRSRPTA